ncbi:MAG: PEP-CTERM system histidine kinase PrsK [Nitrospirae bacterium]|nr:PEP-CTERM system histidine kinase PrsK [Nitrospirota bacterium]
MSTSIAILPAFSALLCLGLGAFVMTRNPRHPANIGFALGTFALFFMETGNTLFLLSDATPRLLFWKRISLAGEIVLPPAWLLFSLTFARANYRETLSRWKPALAATSLLSLFFILWLPSPNMVSFPLDNGPDAPIILGPIGRYRYIYLLLGMVLVLIHLENTLRAPAGVDRSQIKYPLIGVGGILAFQIYLASQALLYSRLDPIYIPAASAVTLLTGGLMSVFIVRHRLLGTDVFISRYVVYNSLTVLFVGGYLLVVGLAAQIIRWMGGSAAGFWIPAFSFAAILAVVIFLLSTGIRRKAQLFINRHFYKHKYEFRDKWLETTERLGAGTSVEGIQKTLVSMVRETLGAKETVLYLFEPESHEFVRTASTLPSAPSSIREDHPLTRRVRETTVPFFLQGDEQQGHEGMVLCAPLVTGQDIIGFLLQGEDLSGHPYGTDDFQILQAISTQAAGQIKNIRLSRELLAAKETEAFHQVSSFFIHDLKNFVSTLSLLVQNAEEHMGDPLFQRDALRTLQTTVSKMNTLLTRLTFLSKGLEIHPKPVNLNDLVDQTLSILNGGISSRIDKEFEALSRISVDEEEVQKVILNLLLNAIEASPPEGRIRVRTRREDGAAIFSISDQGCGMSQEFISSSLFRPFRTTKSKGLGIGLFQCRKIVEAHGGRIEVESEEGKGSEFRVVLPKHAV